MISSDDPLVRAYRLRLRPAGDVAPTPPTESSSSGVSLVIAGAGVLAAFVGGLAMGAPSPQERRAAERREHHLLALQWMIQDSGDPALIERARAELEKSDRTWGFAP